MNDGGYVFDCKQYHDRDDKLIELLLAEAISDMMSKKRHKPKKMSLRKEKTWLRIEEVQKDIDKLLKRMGKKETVSVGKIVELNNSGKVSTLIKHAVVAIFDELGERTNETVEQKFVGSHNIAYFVFREYGLIKKSGFGLTGRGSLRNSLHSREPGEGSMKASKYGRLFNRVFKKEPKKEAKVFYRHKKAPKIKR